MKIPDELREKIEKDCPACNGKGRYIYHDGGGDGSIIDCPDCQDGKVLDWNRLVVLSENQEPSDKLCAGCSCYIYKNGKEKFTKRLKEGGWRRIEG